MRRNLRRNRMASARRNLAQLVISRRRRKQCHKRHKDKKEEGYSQSAGIKDVWSACSQGRIVQDIRIYAHGLLATMSAPVRHLSAGTCVLTLQRKKTLIRETEGPSGVCPRYTSSQETLFRSPYLLGHLHLFFGRKQMPKVQTPSTGDWPTRTWSGQHSFNLNHPPGETGVGRVREISTQGRDLFPEAALWILGVSLQHVLTAGNYQQNNLLPMSFT